MQKQTSTRNGVRPIVLCCLTFLLCYPCEAITINGSSNQSPHATVAQDSLNFADAWLDSNPSWGEAITITNDGTEPLIISSVYLTNPDFHGEVSETITIPPPDEYGYGNTYDFYFSFFPSSLGNIFGEIVFVTNDPSNPTIRIPVTGRGVQNPLGINSIHQTLVVNQVVNMTIFITNASDKVIECSVDANVPGIMSANYSSISIQPEVSASVNLQFNSNGRAAGSYEGFLNVISNVTNRVVTIPVFVDVIDNNPLISPFAFEKLEFGEVWVGSGQWPYALSFTNEGTEPLIISQMNSTHPNFNILGFPSGGVTIPPQSSYEASIDFGPTSIGEIDGEINIVSNDPLHPVVTIQVHGTGVPSPLHISSLHQTLLPDQRAVQTIFVNNPTDSVIQYHIYAGGNYADLINTNISVNPGESEWVDIHFNSYDLLAGHYEDYFYIATLDASQFVTIPLILDVIDSGPIITPVDNQVNFEFGETWKGSVEGPFCVSIDNKGNKPLIISQIISTNPDFVFDAFPAEGIVIPPADVEHDSYYPCMGFHPTSLGLISGDIIIISNDSLNPIVRMHVWGTGIPSPIDKNSLADTLFTNSQSVQHITFSNNTSIDHNYEFYTGDEYDILDDVYFEFTLAPGQSKIIEIVLNSFNLSAGTYLGDFYLYTDYENGFTRIPVTLEVISSIRDFSLTYYKSGNVISTFNEMITLDVADPDIEKYTIQANTATDDIGSVQFTLDGHTINVDNSKPFTIDNWELPKLSGGLHTFSAQTFSRRNGRGDASDIRTTHISITNSATITHFTLVDENGSVLREIFDGDVINMGQPELAHINVVANSNITTIRSVLFNLNGITARIDNSAPFAVSGKSNGNEVPWPIKPGAYTLTATPYMKYYAWGPAGISLTIHFTVVNSPVSAMSIVKLNDKVASPDISIENQSELFKQKIVSVYPVPTKDEVQIYFHDSSDGIVRLRILNMKGSVVYTKQGTTDTFKNYLISTEQLGLSSGMYIIQIQDSNGRITTERFIKE